MSTKKRVFIIHGWDGYPEEGWFPWLKKELESRGFEVFVPQLPDAVNPRINKWVQEITEIAGVPDRQTYFVGHSMGCKAIVSYLQALPEGAAIGGAVFVAGFFKRLINIEGDPETQETARLWLTAPVDFEKVRSRLQKSVAIFSDDDPWVPLDNKEDFEKKLGSEIIIEHNKGHFSGLRDKCTELPVALEAILKISKN